MNWWDFRRRTAGRVIQSDHGLSTWAICSVIAAMSCTNWALDRAGLAAGEPG